MKLILGTLESKGFTALACLVSESDFLLAFVVRYLEGAHLGSGGDVL